MMQLEDRDEYSPTALQLVTEYTRLTGSPLKFAQASWLILFILINVFFLLGIPRSISATQAIDLQHPRALEERIVDLYVIIFDIVAMFLCAGVSLVAFLRRPNDWLTMLNGLMQVMIAFTISAVAFESPIPKFFLALVAALCETGQQVFIWHFPDGRVKPRWLRFLFVPFFLWRFIAWNYFYSPAYFTSEKGGVPAYLPQDPISIAIILSIDMLSYIVFLYRYRREATLVQKQQIKWVMLAIFITIASIANYYIFVAITATIQPFHSDNLFLLLVSRTMRQLAMIQVMVILTYAVLRYKLWEVDRAISRTLTTSLLIIALALIYWISLVVLQTLLHVFSSGQQLAITGSTLLIAFLIHPLRARFKSTVDRYFNRSTYVAVQRIAAFSRDLRGEADLDLLVKNLHHVIEDTVQPTHISLWLRPVPARRNDEIGAKITKPLMRPHDD